MHIYVIENMGCVLTICQWMSSSVIQDLNFCPFFGRLLGTCFLSVVCARAVVIYG